MCYAVMTLCGISVTLCFRGQKLVLRRDYVSDFKRDGLRSCYLIFLTNVS